MSRTRTHYNDTVELLCTDNGQSATAEILEFKPENRLICSVNRQIKVSLVYDKNKKHYVGNMGGLEFTTSGPDSYTTKEGR